MKRIPYRIVIVLGMILILVLLLSRHQPPVSPIGQAESENAGETEKSMKQKNMAPSEWFVRQRAYPQAQINIAAYREAVDRALRMRAVYPQSDEAVWEEAGPNNIGGRITGLGVHPSAPNVVYAGSASGGVLKSVDGGTSWSHIFDETGVLSIGAVAIDPSDPDRLWVGTGEANAPGDTYVGDGIYLSTDGGASWQHMGLDNSYQIGRIAVDPANPQKVFVAVCGALYDTNPERGLYRTENGGISWERVLYLTDSTAAVDVAINPQNTNIVYAVMWERIRHPANRLMGGETSGIWRSTDGGDSWNELTHGLPGGVSVGRIGITIFSQNPDILYAIYADHPGYLMGVWKTTDGGDSWTQAGSPSSLIYLSYGWFFGHIVVDPVDSDKVYALGLYLFYSYNGGYSWEDWGYEMHVDHHALWINPNDPDQIYDGTDGGVYYTNTGGSPWTKSYDLHISQFYAIEIDYMNPYRLYGGTQDNGTLRTWTGALDDWEMIYGGDGFNSIVDYTNSNIIFAETQYGGLARSTNGGSSFFTVTSGITTSDRRNWSTPVVMDPIDPEVMYYGTYRLYKTDNQADDWEPISDDLTNGPSGGNLTYNTITTIDVAPTNTQVIYVGTDDGNAWVTLNGGRDWNSINTGLPERWVTRVAVSPQDASIAYVTLSGYKIANEYLPHVFRTTDYGTNWLDISSNLPEAPVNCIVEDSENPQRLIVAADLGVYYSENLGLDWQLLGVEIPLVAVHDLKIHNPTRTLVAGTHGRSMYKTSLDSLSAAPDVTVSLTPESTSIQIPANGGTFDFNIAIANNDPAQQTFDAWIMVQLPDSSWYGPVLGPFELTLSSGGAIDRDRTQNVPAGAPAGTYIYTAYIGSYPDIIWTQDQFDFEKLGTSDGSTAINDWSNWGEALTGAIAQDETSIPSGVALYGAYPNPFNPTTTISFTLPEARRVNLSVYDITGRIVAELVDGWRDAGVHEVTFDGSDFTSGVYVYRLQAGQFKASGKMVLVK